MIISWGLAGVQGHGIGGLREAAWSVQAERHDQPSG
jgi:hypothetical protein